MSAVPHLPLEDIPARTPPEQLTIEKPVAGEVPFYLQDWFAVPVLFALEVVPVVVGYWWFLRSGLES